MDVKIDKIILKLGKREIALGMEEARDLFNALEKLFGSKVIHVQHDNWYWRYPYPAVTWCGGTSNTSEVLCSTSGNTLQLSCSSADALQSASKLS